MKQGLIYFPSTTTPQLIYLLSQHSTLKAGGKHAGRRAVKLPRAAHRSWWFSSAAPGCPCNTHTDDPAHNHNSLRVETIREERWWVVGHRESKLTPLPWTAKFRKTQPVTSTQKVCKSSKHIKKLNRSMLPYINIRDQHRSGKFKNHCKSVGLQAS